MSDERLLVQLYYNNERMNNVITGTQAEIERLCTTVESILKDNPAGLPVKITYEVLKVYAKV